jgi:hypothetical protein
MNKPIAIATALLCLCLASSAQAKNDPLRGGHTKLTLDKGFLSFLEQNELKLSARAGAKRKGLAYTLGVSGGSLDPTTGKGQIEQDGTLSFEGKKGKVPLRDIAIKTRTTPFFAKVGGSQLKVATSKQISSKREGFGSSFQAKALALTAKAVTRLNKKLRPEFPFHAGQPIGSLVAKPLPQLVTIEEQNKATLVFDSAFASKLEGLFVSLNPIYPSEHVGATFTFPIVRGSMLAPSGAEGTLMSGGAVELLQLHGGQLFWKELWLDLGARSDTAEVDLEPSPPFPGKLGRLGVFDLGAAAVVSDPKARTISVSSAPLTLSAQSAQSLNEAFAGGKGTFAAGELAGSVSFVGVGQ